MKYFNELSDSDKERALTKLVMDKKLKFKCLTRAATLVSIGGVYKPCSTRVYAEGVKQYETCSVVKYYFKNSVLMCDVVLDKLPEDILEGIYAKELKHTDTAVPTITRNSEDINKAKKGLITLLTTGKYYMFDHKCNAYPV